MPSSELDLRFEVRFEPKEVTLLIHSAQLASLPLPLRSDVERALLLKKVVHGVDWMAVDQVIQGRLFDTPQIIGTWTPAKESRNAYIEELVKVDSDTTPQILLNGTVDYKKIDNIHCVSEGEVLAVKHPAVPGEAGMDVFGKPIPVKPPKDIRFRVGANVSVSPEGDKLLALMAGFVYRHGGAICVGKTYLVRGDVNFKTGNIKYQGEVVVLGNVTGGFTVEADGDVLVEGTVEDANVVSHHGSVRIKQGIFGHGKGYIAAKSSLHILCAQGVLLECEGRVEVEKELRLCRVVAGSIKADKPGCRVLCGTLKSYADISIAILGAEGCRSEIHIVDSQAEAAGIRLRELEAGIKQFKAHLEPSEKKINRMQAMVKKFRSRVSPRALMELKEALEQHDGWSKSLAGLEAESRRILEEMPSDSRHTAKCVVTEKVGWGTILNLYGNMQEMEEGNGGREWRWTPEGSICRSLSQGLP